MKITNPENSFPARAALNKVLLISLGMGVLLSSLGLADFIWRLGLCGSNVCEDPRWRSFGSVGSLPIAGLGILVYVIAFIAALRLPLVRFELLSAVALSATAHFYLLLIQYFILHDFCRLCLLSTIVSLTSFGLTGYAAAIYKAPFRLVSAGILLGMIAPLFLWLAHKKLEHRTSPDALIRSGLPPIYRPEAVNSSKSLVELMHESRSQGHLDARVQIDVFFDFQCEHCAKLNADWPIVEDQLRKIFPDIRTTYRIFTLEGHHQAWRASLLALAAGSESKFFLAKDQLFKSREGWIVSGDVETALRDILSVNPTIASEQNIAAAKTLIRMDAAEGAVVGIKAAPSVVLRSKYLKNPIILTGIMSQDSYVKEVTAYVKAVEQASTRR